MHERIMAIDYGDSKIGVAYTDELGITIQPGSIIYTKGSNKIAIKEIKNLIVEKKIKTLVIGMPFNSDGSEGFRVEKTKTFIKRLKNNLKYSGFEEVQIKTTDESYTTIKADNMLKTLNINQKKGKKLQDSLAAYYILEQYLNEIVIKKRKNEKDNS